MITYSEVKKPDIIESYPIKESVIKLFCRELIAAALLHLNDVQGHQFAST